MVEWYGGIPPKKPDLPEPEKSTDFSFYKIAGGVCFFVGAMTCITTTQASPKSISALGALVLSFVGTAICFLGVDLWKRGDKNPDPPVPPQ